MVLGGSVIIGVRVGHECKGWSSAGGLKTETIPNKKLLSSRLSIILIKPFFPRVTKCATTGVLGNFATLARQLPPASDAASCSFD